MAYELKPIDRIPPLPELMRELFFEGRIFSECSYSFTSDGLHVLWHQKSGTGFVFGNLGSTGSSYREITTSAREDLIRKGYRITGDVHDSSLKLEAFKFMPQRQRRVA